MCVCVKCGDSTALDNETQIDCGFLFSEGDVLVKDFSWAQMETDKDTEGNEMQVKKKKNQRDGAGVGVRLPGT